MAVVGIPLALKLRAKHGLARLRLKLLGEHVEAVLTQTYNGLLLVAPEDFSIGRQLAFGGEYNRKEIEIMSGMLDPSSRVLIVGAHVGTILVPLAKIVREIVGIEANPRTFTLLTKNIALNECPNVTLLPLAASDKGGNVEFLLGRTNSGGSKIKTEAGAGRLEFVYDRPPAVTVRSARLDDVLQEESFDLILMDIEGSEYMALLGMPRTLERARTLVIEIMPNHIENVAGVSWEQFLSSIPSCFERAQLLGSKDPTMPRSDFAKLIHMMWKDVYFDGCDAVFTR